MTNEAIKTINASDIKPDDEWMQENEWDAIYAKEMTKEQFKKFAKEEFGYDISFEKTDEPDTFKSLFGSCKGCEHAPTTYIDAIMDGVELPKGHGDLIDDGEVMECIAKNVEAKQ